MKRLALAAILTLTMAVAFASDEADKKINPSETGATYIGDVVTDAMRSALGADIAFINGASLGYEALPEKLGKENLSKVVPFTSDAVVAVKMKGDAILSALEQSCSRLPRRSSTFLQVSGLAFTCDVNKEPGKRVSAAKIGSSALEPGKEYTVATTEFISSGGGGLKSFKDSKPAGEKTMTIGDIVLKNANYDGKKAGAPSSRIKIIDEKK